MGSLVKGVLPSQEGGLGAKAGEQQTETVVARGLLNDQPDSGVVCRFYTQCDETNKTGNGLNVSVCDDVELVCQFCNTRSKLKDLGRVLCFQSSPSDGRALYLHHACASFATSGRDINLVDLVDALEMASRRRCRICSQLGACIQCSYGDCDKWYHLQCSMGATDVVVDIPQGYLFCPKHTVPDSDDSSDEMVRSRKRSKKCVSYDMDDDFALSLKKPRSFLGGVKKQSNKRRDRSSGRNKANGGGDAVQRPRTDWQRRGSNTWVKVVPPWWCEQKTVHFANKVFRELFNSGMTVNLVDDQGGQWTCDVVSETRNDMRLQYTLKGQFQDLWDSISITPGDVLMFEKSTNDPNTIVFTKHSDGFEDLFRGKPRKNKDSEQVTHKPPVANKFVSETPWHFPEENKAIKILQASNLAKMKCYIPESLWSKIFSKPDIGNTFAVYDADLKKHFVFEIETDSKSNKHIVGKGFMSWLIERAVKPADGIQMCFSDGNAVHVSKLPSNEMKRPVDSSTDTLTTCSSTSMDTLAAAAYYACTHGTPGIKAILCDCSSEEPGQLRDHIGHGDIVKKDREQATQVLPGKPIDPTTKKVIAKTEGINQLVDPKISHATFHATMKVISGFTWTVEEHDLILKFRAKYAALDYIGKEITSYSILRFKDNKAILLEILKSFVASIPAKPAEQ